ncbi:MAG: hypothetical protein RL701_1506 [Pseudomonadota bacterium]|jgi:hypothetical protein
MPIGHVARDRLERAHLPVALTVNGLERDEDFDTVWDHDARSDSVSTTARNSVRSNLESARCVIGQSKRRWRTASTPRHLRLLYRQCVVSPAEQTQRALSSLPLHAAAPALHAELCPPAPSDLTRHA